MVALSFNIFCILYFIWKYILFKKQEEIFETLLIMSHFILILKSILKFSNIIMIGYMIDF